MAHVSVTCPACGADELVRGEPIALHEIGDFRCDACGARTVYGRLMPRIAVEPTRGANDMLFIRARIQDPKTREDLFVVDLDPKMAVELTRNILSLVRL